MIEEEVMSIKAYSHASKAGHFGHGGNSIGFSESSISSSINLNIDLKFVD